MKREGRKILFITTKNTDYIRNVQEIKMLRAAGNDVDVVGCAKGGYPERLFRVYSWLLFHSVKKYDEVFVGFSPQLVVPVFYRKFAGRKLTVDFFISVYDTLVNDRHTISPDNFAAKIARYVDERTIKYADRIITDTKADKEYFASEFCHDAQKREDVLKKMEVLYLEADSSLYYPMEVKRPDRLKDKYICLYFGSILPLQGVDTVLEAVSKLKKYDKLYFYIIGPVSGNYEKVIGKNIEYIEWLPQDKLAGYIAMADICLAGHFNGHIDKAKRTIPGKAYIYRAMGKSMILGDNSANHELYDGQETGIYYVPMGNADALSERILKCAGIDIEGNRQEKISVIVPVYNTRDYIAECIESILRQNYDNIELILVDDGSTDGSGDICDDYEKKHKDKIVVLHTPNRGPSAARNTGIDAADGEYLLFVDGDDIISFDHVYRLYGLVKKYDADMAACGYLETSQRNFMPQYSQEELCFDTGQAMEDILYQKHINSGPVCKLYKRKLFDNVRFPEGTFYEDTIAIPKVIHNADKIVWSRDITYGYFMREGSTMRAGYSERTYQYVKVTEELMCWVGNNYPKLRKAAVSRFVWANIYVYIKMPKKAAHYGEVKNNIRKYSRQVLADRKVRRANKAALVLSLMGHDVVSSVYSIKNRRR